MMLVYFIKWGWNCLQATGPKIVDFLKRRKKKVFLDLKLHDIPETVRRALLSIENLGADFTTVHGLSSVLQVISESNFSSLKILAVTVLTSDDDDDVKQDGYCKSLQEIINDRCANADKSGAYGIILSAKDLPVYFASRA